MQLALKGILGAILLSLSGAASAITWDWSFDGGTGNSGSGTLTTDGLSSGIYQITGITGTWDGSNITGLEPNGAYALYPPLYPGDPQLQQAGFDFVVAGQGNESISYSYYAQNYVDQQYVAGTFSAKQVVATQAPEIDPNFAASGAALLVGGLLVLRGRKQRAIAA